jgi:hypothetical protein
MELHCLTLPYELLEHLIFFYEDEDMMMNNYEVMLE